MRLTLKDDGYPFLKVMQGRKWIGRVFKNAGGTWDCMINKHYYFRFAKSAEEAFQEGGARFFGHASNADLKAHNHAVSRKREAIRADAQETVRGMLSPDRNVREAAYEHLFNKMYKS